MSTEAPTQFSYRSQKELTVWNGYPEYKPVKTFEKPETATRAFQYSKYGHAFAYATAESVKVFGAGSQEQWCEIKRPNVIDLWLSPQGSYIATWERTAKLEDGSGSRNLVIWDTKTAEEIASFSQKAQNNWNFQWTDDEKYCARMVTGEIQFWESRNAGKAVWARLKMEGIAQFSLSPGKSPAVAVFVPERNGAPAIVRLFSVPNFSQPLSNKTFFKADRIQVYWNDLGTSLLVLTSTDVDKTGKSYYGENNLYYMAVAGTFDCRVPLDKEGSVHDVTWGPDSKEFVVIYGAMPAKATLFDHRANPVHCFGIDPRNFVKFNPQGRIICIAGFGNLNGTIDLYDRKTLTKIKSFQAPNASHCEWSPCGRFLLTATLTPRLRVDNGFKMWHHTGTLIYEESVNELYQVGFRPEPATKYPMRSISPPPQPIQLLSATDTSVKPIAKPLGAYRPPHMRAGGAPTSLAQREADMAIGRTTGNRKNNSTPVGAKFVSKKKDGKKEAAPVASKPAINGEEIQKKIRNLEKKLRQIKDLKDKQADGQVMEAPQLQKISTEPAVLKELSNLHALA